MITKQIYALLFKSINWALNTVSAQDWASFTSSLHHFLQNSGRSKHIQQLFLAIRNVFGFSPFKWPKKNYWLFSAPNFQSLPGEFQIGLQQQQGCFLLLFSPRRHESGAPSARTDSGRSLQSVCSKCCMPPSSQNAAHSLPEVWSMDRGEQGGHKGSRPT